MNERDLIGMISGLAGVASDPGLVAGIGDDCAVIGGGGDEVWLLSTDTLVEGVHFDPAWHPPRLLGRKAVSVTVSDVAAMGGRPRFILLSLGLPAGFSDQWAADLGQGLSEACRRYRCALIGGDTVRSPAGVCLTLTVLGSQRRSRVLYRSGARAGDVIMVTGPLGLAAAGLALFSAGRMDQDRFPSLARALLDPRARCGLGPLLAESGLVTAMMDLSDGLGTDLSHICRASGLGARVVREQVPATAELTDAACLLAHDPLDWQVSGGEDFELLLTVSPGATEKLQEMVAGKGQTLYPVGEMVNEQGVVLEDRTGSAQRRLDYSGYDHFHTG